GYASIGALSERVGSQRFGTGHRRRDASSGRLDGGVLPVDLAANAASLGARVLRARSIADLQLAMRDAMAAHRTTVVHIETDPSIAAPSSEAWWDVPVAEVSELDSSRAARARYEQAKRTQRALLG